MTSYLITLFAGMCAGGAVIWLYRAWVEKAGAVAKTIVDDVKKV